MKNRRMIGFGYVETTAIYYIYLEVIPNIYKPQNCRLLRLIVGEPQFQISTIKTYLALSYLADTVNVPQLKVLSDQIVFKFEK